MLETQSYTDLMRNKARLNRCNSRSCLNTTYTTQRANSTGNMQGTSLGTVGLALIFLELVSVLNGVVTR